MFARLRERLEDWWRRRAFYLVGCLFLAVIVVITFFPYIFYTIESGHAGVMFRRFLGGTVTSYVRDEGFQAVPPWDKLIVYDVRVQQIEHSFHVISSNGLEITITLSIRYHPRVELLGMLHKKVGPDYLQKIVLPEVQALIREVFGQYSPEEMYTTKRSLIQEALQGALGEMSEEFVVLDDLLIKTITLPASVAEAIEAKLVEEQRSLEMRFRIEREKQEADRKLIEAGGVDKAQELIGHSLTDQLLQYKGIEATLALAQSHNAKVVVIGGKNGLPIIFDSSFSESGVDLKGLTNRSHARTVTNLVPNAAMGIMNRPASTNRTTPR